jgi:hypothetical protein
MQRDFDATDPSITVRFDPDLLTRQEIVDITVQSLEAQADPVYERPVSVTHVEG